MSDCKDCLLKSLRNKVLRRGDKSLVHYRRPKKEPILSRLGAGKQAQKMDCCSFFHILKCNQGHRILPIADQKTNLTFLKSQALHPSTKLRSLSVKLQTGACLEGCAMCGTGHRFSFAFSCTLSSEAEKPGAHHSNCSSNTPSLKGVRSTKSKYPSFPLLHPR